MAYTYVHCRPDGTPFYVGKGALRRAKYLGERNAHHKAVVAKYGAKNILIGIIESSTAAVAYQLEIGLIKCLKRSGVKLCNYTAGGDGGREPCEETRRKLSAAAKKRGVSLAAQLARNTAKRGKPLSSEQKLKQSLAMKGRVFTEEHRKNISISAKRRGVSVAFLEKGRAAATGRVHSAEEKAKRNASRAMTLLRKRSGIT